MNWRKRLLRVIALSLSTLGGVFGGAVGAKGDFYEMTGLPEWAAIAEWIISTVLGAFTGFCFIWFIFWSVHWFVANLFEDVSE